MATSTPSALGLLESLLVRWQGAGLTWRLQKPVEMGRHPLRVGVMIIIIFVILIGRIFLGPSIAPRLGPTLLEHLPGEILLPLLLLLCIKCGLVFLSRGAPLLVVGLVLLH